MNRKNIALWVFGIFFIIAGLGALSASLLGGLLYILGGVALLPIAQNKLSSLIKRGIGTKWFVIFAVIMMLLAPMIINFAERSALENGTASQELIDRQARVKELHEKEQAQKDKAQAEQIAKSESLKNDPQLVEIRNNRLAREFVLSSLKDPNSAEFRNQKGFCGEVNAKNSFGGYSGFKRFIATSETLIVMEDMMTTDEFDKVWTEFCK